MKATLIFTLTLLLGFACFLTIGTAQTYVHHTNFTYETGLARALAFSPDGQMLASGGGPVVYLDAPRTDRHLRSLESHTKPVMAVAFSPNGRVLASASGDRTIKLWNPHTGELIRTLQGHTNQVYAIAFSQTGQLASGGRDNTVRLWNTQTGENLILGQHGDWVLGVAFSSTGLLASSGRDNTIRIWNATTAAPLRTLTGHTNFVTSVAFTATGDTLVSGSRDNTIRIWNAATGGAALQTLRGHTDAINSVAVSASGTIASAGADETVRLWKPQTGRFATLDEHTDLVRVVAFSRDGQWLASGSVDGAVQLWRRSGLDETQVVAPPVVAPPAVAPTVEDAAIHIPDDNLAKSIRDTLQLGEGTPITAAAMRKLTELEASGRGIADLTGLEYATQLKSLILDGTDVSDIAALANLTNLETLNLNDTKVSDIAALANLTNLETLWLNNTNVSDISPLANLTNLRWLLLTGTNVSDIAALANLTNLEVLYLDGTDVSDIAALANLTNLEYLFLKRCPLNNAAHQTHIPALLAKGIEVEYDEVVAPPVVEPPVVAPTVEDAAIHIPDTYLAGAIRHYLELDAGAPITAAAMRKLTELGSGFDEIVDLTGLQHATNLEYLNLYKEKVSDVSPLANLPKLEHLRLELTNVSDISPLANLPNLEKLDLSETQVSDISPLANLPNLTHLYLSGTQVWDVAPLANLPKLKTLGLHRCPLNAAAYATHIPALQAKGVSVSFDKDAAPVAEPPVVAPPVVEPTGENGAIYIPDLSLAAAIREALELGKGAPITAAAMRELTNLDQKNTSWQIADLTGLQHATQLETLKVTSGGGVSDISPLANLTNLEELWLTNTHVSDISALAKLTNLEVLYLADTYVSDISVLANLTNLRDLGFGGTYVRDISALANLTNLEELWLTNTHVSDISALAKLTNLKRLRLTDTYVSDISALANLTNLEVLYLTDTYVSDISVLANLPKKFIVLNLEGCPLNKAAYDTHIPALLAKGMSYHSLVLDYRTYRQQDETPVVVPSGDVDTPSIRIRASDELLDTIRETLQLDRATPITADTIRELTELHLDEYHMKFVDLRYATQLKTLTLSGYSSTEDYLPLANLTQLETLTLNDCAIKDASFLANLTQLKTLVLHNTLDFEGFSVLANLPQLKTLVLSGILPPDGTLVLNGMIRRSLDVSFLANLTQLETLVLRNTYVSDISALANLPQLKTLDHSFMEHHRGLEVPDFSVLATLPQLETLTLDGPIIHALEDFSFLANLTQLKRLLIWEPEPSNVSVRATLTQLEAKGVQVELDILLPDGFYQRVREVLELDEEARLTPAAMRELTEFSFQGGDAEFLPDGLKYATQLKTLTVGHRGYKYLSQPYKSPPISDISVLATLPQLESLGLSYTDVSDISVLATLPQLERLYLDGTQVSDVSVLANLTQLESLDLSSTQVSDFSVLANLPNLEELDLDDTDVSDISVLANLTGLKALHLNNTKVSDISVLANLTQLQTLGIAGCPLNNAARNTHIPAMEAKGIHLERDLHIPDANLAKALGGSSGITTATIRQVTIVDATDSSVADLTGLEKAINLYSLYLSGTQVSDISALANLPKLDGLYLSGTQVSDISVLATLPQLEELGLNNTQVSDISVLAKHTDLMKLELKGTDVSDISALANLTKLEELYLDGTDVSDISALAKHTDLRELDLSGTQVSDISVLATLTNLVRLDLSSTQVSDIAALATLTKLASLDLSGTQVSDFSVPATLPKLASLDLSNTQVSDISVLAKHTKLGLVSLGLNNTQVSDISVLAKHTYLRELGLNNTQVSDISALAKHTNLEELNFKGSPLSPASHTHIRAMRKRDIFLKVTAPPPPVTIYGLSIAEGKDLPNWGGNRFIILTQYGNTCGTTSLEMVLRYYAKNSTQWKIWEAGDVNSVKAGTWPGEMRQALNELGVPAHLYDKRTATYRDDPFKRLRRYVDGNRPPCLLIKYADNHAPTAALGGEVRYHWLVVVGYHYDSDAGVDNYLLADPSGEFRWESRFHLDKVWGFKSGSPYGYWNSGFNPFRKTDWIHLAVDVAADPYTAIVPRSAPTKFGGYAWTEYGDNGETDDEKYGPKGYHRVEGEKILGGRERDWSKTIYFDHKFDTYSVSSIGFSNNGGTATLSGWKEVGNNGVKVWGRVSDGWVIRGALDIMVRPYRWKSQAAPSQVVLTRLPAPPAETALLPNYPNPFNPETWIPYQLSVPADVAVSIYAIDGRLVRRLDLGQMPSGVYQSRARAAYWDGRNATGEPVASGIYFYTFTAGDFKATRKMVIRK